MEAFEADIPIDCLCCTSSALVAGGYLFNEGVRSGKIYFYSLESMNIEDEFTTSGTLDIKVSEQTLYSANSSDISAIHLGSRSTIKMETAHINTYVEVYGSNVFVFDVGGRVNVYSKEMTSAKVIKAGDAPIWALKASDKELICGSEDGMLRFVDTRTFSEHHTMKRTSGITSMYEYLEYLYVGSYDECIEIIDKRKYEIIKKVRVGGGIWRICKEGEMFYLSCMYEGLKVCDCDLNVMEKFPTNSIAYGLTVKDSKVFFTSFYDKKIYKFERHVLGICE
ncbi:hypothetical protein EROM_070210 [Encephalitozoon romaleae SJ-2008]|uniref:WD40 domain-containing protein n=1 Tax=Encephalitozoon romaleae (strain SJ-2008) TaxID=1178016 RepID=I7AS78_ENCRO|nr:hypothetical protein EROM_070210 [Encephalitozoon romaleae SJ-2008]AFN83272.1 hypothetical protein EROM_070210 [Encephalitozoon romaleae SJ-2008]